MIKMKEKVTSYKRLAAEATESEFLFVLWTVVGFSVAGVSCLVSLESEIVARNG